MEMFSICEISVKASGERPEKRIVLNFEVDDNYSMQETVTISKSKYIKLKRQAEIDMDLLNQFLESFRDIKEGRIRRVK